MNRDLHFASPIYTEYKPEWVDKLNILCDDYINTPKNIGDSFCSTSLIDDENFNEFHGYIAEKSKWVLDDIGYDLSDYGIVYNESWVQEFSLEGGGNHLYHTHSNSHISAFYFLHCTVNTSKPAFQDPRTSHLANKLPLKNKNSTDIGQTTIHYPTKPGTLLLFPSYLSHGYTIDWSKEKFRFIHVNLQAIENRFLYAN